MVAARWVVQALLKAVRRVRSKTFTRSALLHQGAPGRECSDTDSTDNNGKGSSKITGRGKGRVGRKESRS